MTLGATAANTQVQSLSASQVDLSSWPTYPTWAALSNTSELGQLYIDPFCGLAGAYNPALSYSQQGPYVQFCTHGGRSFAVLDPAKNGSMVYDSADDVEVGG